jgi:hypothetical protein
MENDIDVNTVTLFSHPILGIKTLGEVLVEKLKDLYEFSKEHWIGLIITVVILFCSY